MASFASRVRSARGRFVGKAGMFAKSTLKTEGVGVAVGGVAQLVAQLAGENVEMVGTRWYSQPIGLLVLSMLTRRRPTISLPLAGAAGYAAMFNYKLNQYQAAKSQKPPFGQFTATAGSSGTRALPEGYAGALHQAGVDFAVVG